MKKISLYLGLIFSIFLSFSFTKDVEAINSKVRDYVTIELSYDSTNREGTSFSIFGITETEYEYALSKNYDTSVEKTREWLRKQNSEKIKDVLISHTYNGTFDLPRYNEKNEKMYYLILQNKPDLQDLNGFSFYTSYPIFLSFDDVEEDYLVIDMKRIFLIQTPYFFKYSSGDHQKPLEGAEFAFYQLTDKKEKEYLMSIDPIEWSVTESSKTAYQFKSDKDGLVDVPDLGLELGTYYFEETKAPNGFEITKESQKISLAIEETEEGLLMTINGEKLYPSQAGDLPKDIITGGLPRVLNNPIPPVIPKEPDPKVPPKEEIPKKEVPKKEKPSKGFLPQTGESRWAFSSVGLLLMAFAIFYKKRRNENE
ncbi:prealbumin-like fold domain-containing protein [Vagococcus fluvialis]|uniref:prealbumin-like fold domain-containing protein n=1 Tax=Vagococcus fluvialis TaxID=2738 RepID=UPI001A90910A|nr:prealbumin-like fold domain-containing protein [Vagococcus fluvialis]MBO0437439.1 LPXTG cell wall anchor domain-containing protein [Vagococcus fluvialis]